MKKSLLLALPALLATHALAAPAVIAPLALLPTPLAAAAVSLGFANGSPATAQESEFGEPVTVNGVRISDMAIKRFLVYGPGRNALDARKLQILMDHERELRKSGVREEVAAEMGAASDAEIEAEVEKRMERFNFDPAALERRLTREREGFQERYPTLDHEVELKRAYGSGDWYRDQVRQTMEFDELFFPDHPDTWPELSVEAIHANSPQVDLIEDYGKYYEQRLAIAQETGNPIEPEQEMMMSLLRDFVMGALWTLADVKTSTQGIPENLAMVIDGGDWRAEIETQDVYDEMKASFTVADIENAKRTLALMEAAKQKLAAAEMLMPEEDFKAMVSDMRTQMEGGMFNMDFMALQGHGFPSAEAYEDHLRLVESYKKMVADKLVIGDDGTLSPELQAHMPIANGIMGLAKAHADILLVSAFDFPNYKWKEDGWQKAYERATGLRSQIDEYLGKISADEAARAEASAKGENYAPQEEILPFGRWWSDFLRGNSDYWDPPLPVSGKAPPAIGLKNFGAFQDAPMTRNDMKRAIGESEYEHFLWNDSIVDKIFFEMEPGTVGGPYLGPKGYYIVYLKSRSAPTNPLNIRTDERHRSMLQEDWMRKSFQRYAHEALAEADTTGI
ncbi:hypothetical protein Poly30_11640 [Planctomycetes bacterium Poly30]|uniref:PpiC domain-containing protein n=1 Tax=Saltatorellus ferox TaxID=2528018 RepID=A0A518ENK8_9BACT|nr:hypothetical protein Poly30_11640 [Planctomycetes bacterium Poly30]